MVQIPEELRPAVTMMDKTVKCLYLELPEKVAQDVMKNWEAVKAYLASQPVAGESAGSAEEAFSRSAEGNMIQFHLPRFKKDFPLLFNTIIKAMQSYASSKDREIAELKAELQRVKGCTIKAGERIREEMGGNEYVPYSEEWAKEMEKMPKKYLIENFIRPSLLETQELRKRVKELEGACEKILTVRRNDNEDWKYPFNRAWHIAHNILNPKPTE